MLYFDAKSEAIVDFLPQNIPEEKKEIIRELWAQPICRAILKFLTKSEKATAPKIKEAIGHSMSTLHENIKKLEYAGLIKTEMIYEGNKQKIIEPTIMCVSRNTKMTEAITRFLNQGLWVDTERGDKIIDFLKNNNKKFFTVEEISAKTGIQVDEVQTLLDNWDSQVTRSFSQMFKKRPFEKQTRYRGL